MRRSLLLIYLCILGTTACNPSRQILKLMEKDAFKDVKTKLDKALLKDSLNADLYYVYSLLYTDTAYTGYNIDSSFFYIQRAIDDFGATDAKIREQQKNQIGMDSLLLVRQKLLNDSLAYERAAGIHSVEAYQDFINQHPAAPQMEAAIRNRNELAYQAASELDTYEAYKEFMDTYPEAEEVEMALERYNTLVFREKTRAGNLQSYLNFLAAFPESPFRPQAEEEILQITTAGNQLVNFESFIREYPQSPHTPFAVNLLFHLYKDRYSAEAFFDKFTNLPLLDSLKRANRLSNKVLAPVYEDGHYGLMDSQGNYLVDTRFEMIPAHYLCDGVAGEVVQMGKIQDERSLVQLLTKSGALIYQYSLDELPDQSPHKMQTQYLYELGAGILLSKIADDQFMLLHQSGKRLLPNGDMSTPLDTAELLSSARDNDQAAYQFIKYQADGLWGLATFSGRVLLAPDYENIEVLDEFMILRKNGKAAVTNRDKIIAVADQKPLELSFIYEDVALLDDQHVVAYTDNYESVININLQVVVPLDRHNIIRKISKSDLQTTEWLLREDRVVAYVKNDSLLNRTESVYYLYDKQDDRKKSDTYERAFFSNNWLSLKNKQGFKFINLQKSSDAQAYDSVKLIGENFALLFKNFPDAKDSVTVLFPNDRKLALASPQDISFLLLLPTAVSAEREYLLIAPRRGQKEVWNQYGQRILMDSFDGLKVFGPGLFVIEKNRKKGLLDSLGNELLPVRYEGISNYQDSLIAIFQNKKFGAYDYASRSLIAPKYEAALMAYGQPVFHPEDSVFSKLYVARKDGKYGVINQQEQALTPFAFDAVRYWNDTAALVQQDGKWSIHRLSRREVYNDEQNYVLYKGINDFDLLEASLDEKVYRIYKDGGYGVLSNQQGELLSSTYDDLRLLGGISDPNSIFLAEKYVPEAELYIVIHLNNKGEIIKRQALTSEQYDKVFCDE